MASLKIIRGSENAPLEPLLRCTVGVIGFGNQGAAHALNLRDSGVKVIVANRRDSANGRRAIEAGFEPQSIDAVVARADLLIIALPDEAQPAVYRESIEPHLRPGQTLGFLHGFAIRYALIQPRSDVGVVMIAPKGPGATLRERFTQGLGIPCLMAVHLESPNGAAEPLALAWANGIGCARAAIIRTTFADETETDLFGEQTVLCGGMTWLMLAAFETLVDQGYPPELAYLECCHEVKQIADLVYDRGIAQMMEAISNTAEFGAYVAGPRLIDDSLRAKLRELLNEIRSGAFAQRLQDDHQQKFAWFHEQRRAISRHPIEAAGSLIRSLMPQPRSEGKGASSAGESPQRVNDPRAIGR